MVLALQLLAVLTLCSALIKSRRIAYVIAKKPPSMQVLMETIYGAEAGTIEPIEPGVSMDAFTSAVVTAENIERKKYGMLTSGRILVPHSGPPAFSTKEN